MENDNWHYRIPSNAEVKLAEKLKNLMRNEYKILTELMLKKRYCFIIGDIGNNYLRF